jgi:hypothetical protein
MAMALEHQFIQFLNMNRYAPFGQSEPCSLGKFRERLEGVVWHAWLAVGSISMKHAGAVALHGLSALLEQIRIREGIKEKSLGTFYRRSKAFLHFHEDPAGLFADLRVDAEFERFPVNTQTERKALLLAIDRALAS